MTVVSMNRGDLITFDDRPCIVRGVDPCGVLDGLAYLEDVASAELLSVPLSAITQMTLKRLPPSALDDEHVELRRVVEHDRPGGQPKTSSGETGSIRHGNYGWARADVPLRVV